MNEETNMQDAMAQDAAHTGMVAPVSGGTAAQRRRWTQSALVAVLSGVLALAALLLYLRRFEQEVSGGPKVRVLYALKNIPLGSAIDAAMLGERAVPSAYLSERQVPASELDRILGVRTSLGLEAGESLLWTDLATTLQQGRDLSALVPKGKRALSIRVDGASTFGQLLRPGDRVDVLLSTRETSETMTGPLLQNVMLLAVGSDTGQARNQGE
ncbi:MAG: Flp pilus assembly protein CpaB, partial [Polyangiales bacterium]